MAERRIERWLTDVFPQTDQLFESISGLSVREAVVVSSAMLDTALAEVIGLRLVGPQDEIDSFLGVKEDGRAPAGSFGSRIQLALLLGVLSPTDARVFRAVKDLRNVMAHRVQADLQHPRIKSAIETLWERLRPATEWIVSMIVSECQTNTNDETRELRLAAEKSLFALNRKLLETGQEPLPTDMPAVFQRVPSWVRHILTTEDGLKFVLSFIVYFYQSSFGAMHGNIKRIEAGVSVAYWFAILLARDAAARRNAQQTSQRRNET